MDQEKPMDMDARLQQLTNDLLERIDNLQAQVNALQKIVTVNAYNARDEIDAMTAVLDQSVGMAVWTARRGR